MIKETLQERIDRINNIGKSKKNLKFRLMATTRNTIEEAKLLFGSRDNEMSKIFKRAKKRFNSTPFEYEVIDEPVNTPVSIDSFSWDLDSKKMQSIVVQYLRDEMEWFKNEGNKTKIV